MNQMDRDNAHGMSREEEVKQIEAATRPLVIQEMGRTILNEIEVLMAKDAKKCFGLWNLYEDLKVRLDKGKVDNVDSIIKGLQNNPHLATIKDKLIGIHEHYTELEYVDEMKSRDGNIPVELVAIPADISRIYIN